MATTKTQRTPIAHTAAFVMSTLTAVVIAGSPVRADESNHFGQDYSGDCRVQAAQKVLPEYKPRENDTIWNGFGVGLEPAFSFMGSSLGREIILYIPRDWKGTNGFDGAQLSYSIPYPGGGNGLFTRFQGGAAYIYNGTVAEAGKPGKVYDPQRREAARILRAIVNSAATARCRAG